MEAINENLQLICGNPVENEKNGGATFSRFIFPFAYFLQEKESEIQQQELCYQQILAENDLHRNERIKYLTNETALVLFERAKWFEIDHEAWKKTPWEHHAINVELVTGDFQIKMLPPKLVLFEFPNKPKIQITLKDEPDTTENSILQTGFLFIDVYFSDDQVKKPTIDDLLKFNELFRYFDMPYEYHHNAYYDCLKDTPVDSFLDANNDYLKMKDKNCATLKQKRKNYFDRWLNYLKIPVNYDGKFFALTYTDKDNANNDWIKRAENWLCDPRPQTSSNMRTCLAHVDNRCFVWSAALLENGGFSLVNPCPSSATLQAHEFRHWAKFLNIDDDYFDPAKPFSAFDKNWAKERTYKRWEEDGTWYGYTEHSGVMLAGVTNLGTKHLCKVFREQHFDLGILLLYLRTSLFRTSRKLTLIIHEEEKECLRREKLRQLRTNFAHFTILYQFPTLSNQQQAIEMYVLARRCFDIDELYREIHAEITNTHDFLEQVEANRLGNAANLLAQWGIPVACASVTASFFGMENYSILQSLNANIPEILGISVQMLIAIGVGYFARIMIKKIINKE